MASNLMRIGSSHVYLTTRTKLIGGFLLVSFLVGAVSLLTGGQLLYNTFLNEARNRIRMDLNAARQMCQDRSEHIRVALDITTTGIGFRKSLANRDIHDLLQRLRRVSRRAGLDIAGVADPHGHTLCRIGPHPIPDIRDTLINPIVSYTMRSGSPVRGMVIFPRSALRDENPLLADKATIKVIPTPMAEPVPEGELSSGLTFSVGIPVTDHDRLLGYIYGAVLLNRNQEIVDTIRDTVFQNETYKGQAIGTATIFFKDIRICTNVMINGKRALGTRASSQVVQKVLGEGKKWTDRAFVVSDWYITAYEPLVDVAGNRVGMLYVGVLEKPYADVRRKALGVFIVLSFLGISVAIVLGYLLERKIMSPIHRLAQAAAEVSEGNLNPDIGPIAESEIAILQKTFLDMLASIREREWKQKEESESQLLQAQKQASVGRLAAGVAHEINNPLTGVLTFSHMLLRRNDLDDHVRSQLETIAQATERVRQIVRGLLDFARQTELNREPTDVNQVARPTLALMENQALIKGVELRFEPGANLPIVIVDQAQLRSVLLNLLLNALDATRPGDRITLVTRAARSGDGSEDKAAGVEIAVSDTGCGIPPENLEKVVDPFFTTKEVGKGTGLGLSVSYGIVTRHGGRLSIESEVGKGSTFKVWLPTGDPDEREISGRR